MHPPPPARRVGIILHSVYRIRGYTTPPGGCHSITTNYGALLRCQIRTSSSLEQNTRTYRVNSMYNISTRILLLLLSAVKMYV